MIIEDRGNTDCFWPVYKGESFDLWKPDTKIYYAWADPKPVLEWIQRKRIRGRKNARSSHSEFTQEYLNNLSTLPCFKPRIAFRDVARSTDSRTIIACLVPPKVFLTHLSPYFLWPRGNEKDQAFMLGVLSSIPFDWYARRFVETHVTFYIINSFPVPRPSRDDLRWQRVIELSGRLASPDDRFVDWAKEVGVACGPIAADEKEDMIHEIDAVVAHLYELKETQLIHIFETFREDWDYQSRLDEVLRYFRIWKSK